MIRNELILFSGGPAIYEGNVPKPLQVVSGGKTLLELYLGQDYINVFDSINICCESDYANAFEELLGQFNQFDISLSLTPPQSTTLEKLASYLSAGGGIEKNLMCTYPDIFYFGADLPELNDSDLTGRCVISVRPLESRLPRLMIDPYSGKAKSISMHHSPNPANPTYMFGGHLLAHSDLLARALHQFSVGIEESRPLLEFDFLSWMISRNLVATSILRGEWVQCDTPRDQKRLVFMIEAAVA